VSMCIDFLRHVFSIGLIRRIGLTGRMVFAALSALFLFGVVGFLQSPRAIAQTTTADAPSYAGFWNKANEAGWGLHIQQHGEFVFAAWYTYAADGSPTWFTMSCKLAGNRCSDKLYTATGKPLSAGLTNVGLNAIAAGEGAITFNSASNLTFTYTALGRSGTISDVQKFNFASADQVPVCTQTNASRAGLTNYTDMWWGGVDSSGWGVSLSHQGDKIFLALYTYSDDGKAKWAVGTATKVAGANGTHATYSGDFSTPANGTPYYAINGSNATTFPGPKTGTFTLTFSAGDAATLAYEITLPGSAAPSVGRVALSRFAVASGATTNCQLPRVAALVPESEYPWPTWTPSIPSVPPSSTGNTYYVDGTNGLDTQTGRTATLPFKTINKALASLAAGDTILIKKGFYREAIDLNAKSVPTGTAAKPITIGSFGDGEVTIDGSAKVGNWTQVSGSVWKAPVSFTPIGVVVNEVPLKQVTQGQRGSTAPQVGLAGVTSGSGKWHIGNGVITADFGTTIGSNDPNQADIVIPNNVGDQAHVFFYGQNYLRFIGLTIRGSGSNGIWGYGSNITVESCNIKFNGKSAVSFLYDSSPGVQTADNAVITSHIYHNVLSNWPRGNNYYAESGGGWPATVNWSAQLRPVARGNIVHMNGGEGIASYGSFKGKQSGSALFEQNVVYDNWSVNMYFDNQPNNVARNNFLFNHPPRSEDYLTVGKYPYNSLEKYTVCLMLGDEQNSSDGVNNYASLEHTSIYNNIIAGCRIGIRDYSEGSVAQKNHGLKNTRIVNNTIIMSSHRYANSTVYGIYLQDNLAPSSVQRNVSTVIQNNIIYGLHNDSLISSGTVGALGGITLSHNLLFSADQSTIGTAKAWIQNGFAGLRQPGAWKNDKHGLYANPDFIDVEQFYTNSNQPFDYTKADVKSSSPAIGAGLPQDFSPAVNFRLEPRQRWNVGAF
jgi:Chondroitinase B